MALNRVLPKVRAMPAQLIELNEAVIIRRGCVEIKLVGEGIKEAIQLVFNATASSGATADEICELFDPLARESVQNLIQVLLTRNILVSEDEIPVLQAPESSADIFYWHFSSSADKVHRKLREVSILILGVNYISRQLIGSLLESGFAKLCVLDHERLRDIRLFDGRNNDRLRDGQWGASLVCPEPWSDDLNSRAFDCLVATSESDNQDILLELNNACVEHRRYFMPALLNDFTGSIGPLVVPGETACFDCLCSRVNSNMNAVRSSCVSNPAASKDPPIIGFHPSMASILGNIAAFELTRFFSGVMTSSLVGSLVQVNLLATQISSRKVLRVPRCKTCSLLKTRSPISPEKSQPQHQSRV